MTDATPYTVPKEPGRWRAIILAALVHAALLAFLWIGIRWQNETPVTIEAEVWSPQPREAAPQPEPVKAPDPVKEPEPQPVVQEPPKPKVVEPPVVKPDIALEQEKKRKAQEEQKRREEEQERLARLKKKEEEERLEKKKAEEERLAKQKLEKEKKAELAKRETEKKRKQEEAEAKRKEEAEAAEQKMMAKLREENLKRMMGNAIGAGGTGDAAKAQGGRTDPSYAQLVGAKIKSNISFNADGMAGNSAVEYVVELLPDGSISGMRQTKSSGVPGFDEAVRRAIEKSQPYPKDKSGSVPSSFVGNHRPKDQ